MLATPENLDHLRATFGRMEQQGLSAEFSGQAQECAQQLLGVLDRFNAPGLAGLGAVVAIIDSAMQGSHAQANMAALVTIINTTNGR